MVSVGVEVTLLAQIHLIVEAKFGNYPWTLLSDREMYWWKKKFKEFNLKNQLRFYFLT